jgi:FkbM family methyltransferase
MLVGSLLERPVTVVDAGARWGVPTPWTWFGPHARAFAFEPDLDEAERLIDQYRGDPSVVVVPVALGQETGTIPFYMCVDPSGSSIYPPSGPPRSSTAGPVPSGPEATFDRMVQVEVVTLDEWLQTSGHGPIDAMKMDVQGAELDILKGASTALETVRMLVAEVHLNKMYDGAALFGEVDGFLREHGFELWRFPVIAHYSQEPDRPPMVDRVDVHWFESLPVAIPALPGQAVWADALYVKQGFGDTASHRDFAISVRDAAVAIGMDEPNLAAVALRYASHSAPAESLPVIEAALEALRYRSPMDSFRSVRLDYLKTVAQPLREPYEVDLTVGTLGWGWHDPIPVADGWVRWTGPQREACIELPLTLPPGSRIEVVVRGGATTQTLTTLVIEVNGQKGALTQAPCEGGVRYTLQTGSDWQRGYTRIVFRTDVTVAWAQIEPGAGDWAEYGVAVSAVTLTPPAGALTTADGV